MTEKPKLVYDAPKRQHLYEWQVGEYLWASEPVFDRTREYVEVLEAENAKLRELCRRFAEYASQDRCEGCVCKRRCNNGEIDECWQRTEIREAAHEFGIEVAE